MLRRLQRGERLGMPHSRPMPAIGRRCHELRVVDAGRTWLIVYRLDADAIVIADVFQNATQQTPTASDAGLPATAVAVRRGGRRTLD